MVSWFSFKLPFSVGIRATHESVEWLVEVWQELEEPLIRNLYGLYPNAQIAVNPKSSAPIGYRLYCFRAASSFLKPLLTVEEFGQLDPLAGIVSALGTLQSDEVVTYSLHLRPVRKEYYEVGEKLLKEMQREAEAAKKSHEIPPFDRTQLQLATTKFGATLKEVEFAVKVKAETKERANDIVNLLNPALAVYERDGCNSLVPSQEKSFELVLSAPEASALWHLPSDQCNHPRVHWAGGAVAPLPQQANQNTDSVVAIGTNSYQGHVQEVKLAYADRVTHINIIGKNGVGKSTLMHHMIHQDIANGKGVGVIDPHGKLVENILACSIPPEREADVVLLDMTDGDYPIGLNLLAAPRGIPPEKVASRAVSVIRKMFADEWHQGRMEAALYAALMTLMEVEGATLLDIARLFHDSDFRSQALSSKTDPIALDFWIHQYEPASPNFKSQIASPITNRINKFYRNRQIRRVICQTGSLDFARLMDDKRIFLANLGGLTDVEAETLGALLIAKFEVATMSRSRLGQAEVAPFYLYIDEVQNFSTTSLDRMFSEARKYGLSLTVANQYLQQLEGDTLEAVFGNTGATIIFRVGPHDAPRLSAFVKPQFTGEDLINLHRFHTVVKAQVNDNTLPAFSMEIDQPLQGSDGWEERLERIRTHSRQTYARPAAEVDAELTQRILAHRQPAKEENEPQGADYFG